MKKHLLHIVALLFAVVVTQKAIAQVSGVRTIPGDYNSITDAIQQLSVVGVNGPTYLELQPGYNSASETFPIIIRKIPGTSDTRPVTISPAAGATALSIVSSTHEYTIELIGAYNIIIDGRPGRQGTSRALTIRNEYLPGHAIGFFDGAVSNKVTYCIVEGRSLDINTSRDAIPVGGTVMFGRSPEVLPANTLFENAANTVSHCKIASINGGITGIYSEGDDAVLNVNNAIVNNEIFNFSAYGFLATGFSSGWTITGNSIYNQLPNNGLRQTGILFHSFPDSFANTISGNFIGGQEARAGGGKWEGQNITGIWVHRGTYTIENNVIRNMNITGTTAAVSFAGILFSSEAGAIAENQIGGTSLSNSITVSGPAFTVVGIQSSFCFPTPIIDNRISYINATQEGSLTNTTLTNTNSFTGITAGPLAQLSGNEVDQLTLTSTDDITFVFIILVSRAKCPQWIPGQFATTIHNNRTHSLKITSEDGEANVTGIEINERLAGNTGNIIGSATAANSIQVSGKNAVINGILVDGEAEYVSVSDDIIANLTATATESASVNGIHFKGKGTTKISGNRIHDLNAPVTRGIFIEPTAGISTATVDNNIVTGTNAGNGVEVSAGEAALNFIAIDNTVSNWQTGFLHTATTSGTLTQTFQNNLVTDNQNGFINQTGGTLDATCNWWGDVSGPSGAGPGKGNPVSPGVVFYPWASVPELIAVNAGADATLYVGYGPTGITLTPAYTVCGEASYLWSTGATTSSVTVSPRVTTTYSITVKDANGHEASDEVTVIVKDVRCGTKNDKVKVCHKKGNGSTLCIAASAVQAHLAHGDELGDCSSNTITESQGLQLNPNETISEEFKVNVYPNPSESDFTIQANIADAYPLEIKVMNAQGQITKYFEATENTIRFGHDLKVGVYIVEIVQGLNRKTIKLIKY